MEVNTRGAVEEAIARLSAGAADEPGPVAEPEVEVSAEPAAEPVEATRERDPSGRFAAKEKPAEGATPKAPPAKPAAAIKPPGEPDGVRAAGAIPAPPAEPVAAAPAIKPPADWRPGAKAEWDKLPRAVQEEAARLHVETKRTLQESAQARQTAETWTRTVAPFENIFRGAGVEPAQGVASVLQQYAALTTGHPQARAAIIGNLVRSFLGTDEGSLKLLVADLDGKPGTQQPQAPQGLSEADIDRRIEQREQKARQDQGLRAWQEFEASDPEYLDNVRTELAEVMGVWQRKNPGAVPTKEVFQQLHDKALLLNDYTAPIIRQRAEAKAAIPKPGTTQAGAAAAVGLKNEPVGPTGNGKAKNTREEVERQVARLSARRV